MLFLQTGRNPQPHQSEDHVQPGKAGRCHLQFRSQLHNPGLNHIAASHKECIDRCLGLVFCLA